MLKFPLLFFSNYSQLILYWFKSFFFARTGFLNIKLSKSNSWKISREIWKRSQKMDIIIKSLRFLYLVKKILSIVFFKDKTVDENGIGLYNKSGLSRIRLFVTVKKSKFPYFYLFSSILTSLSLFFSLASSFLLFTSSKLKTRTFYFCL